MGRETIVAWATSSSGFVVMATDFFFVCVSLRRKWGLPDQEEMANRVVM